MASKKKAPAKKLAQQKNGSKIVNTKRSLATPDAAEQVSTLKAVKTGYKIDQPGKTQKI